MTNKIISSEKDLLGVVFFGTDKDKNSGGFKHVYVLQVRLYPVDLEVWSKLAQRARIKRIASTFARDFDCDWQCVSAISHSVTLTRVLLSQIISYSVTEESVLVVMECKHACKCDLCRGVFTSYFKVNRV